MKTQQIAKTLKDKGFNTKTSGDFVTVSLNREISIMEVEIALSFEAPILDTQGKSIVVMGA